MGSDCQLLSSKIVPGPGKWPWSQVMVGKTHVYMGVVLKPMQEFKYVSDICRYVRVFLLQWRKAAKAWRKVREGSEYHYLYEVCTRKHDHNSVS